jgi:hypothetical protein
MARVTAKWMGTEQGAADRRSQIAWLLKEGATHGAISQVQASLVDEAMELSRTTIGSHAVPLRAAVTVSGVADAGRVASAMRRASRDPVLVLREAGRVEGLISGVPVAGQGWALREPLRLDEGMLVREALSVLSANGVREAIVTRGSLDVGMITTRRLIDPLLDSLGRRTK